MDKIKLASRWGVFKNGGRSALGKARASRMVTFAHAETVRWGQIECLSQSDRSGFIPRGLPRSRVQGLPYGNLYFYGP
mgnify:CR=1 FL=1